MKKDEKKETFFKFGVQSSDFDLQKSSLGNYQAQPISKLEAEKLNKEYLEESSIDSLKHRQSIEITHNFQLPALMPKPSQQTPIQREPMIIL